MQKTGIPLIATNCITNESLFPRYDTERYVSKDIYGAWFRGHPKPGDLIFVLKGSPGRVCVAPDPVDFCIAQDMVALRPDPNKVYPKFLFALLRTKRVQSRIEQMHVGSLIPHFKKGDFDKLLLDIPEPAIQRFVGDLYFSLSEKIELNERIRTTLEASTRTLFTSLFTNFEPVREKKAGREPGLAADISRQFPDAFTETEIGLVPSGWDVASVSEVASIEKGLSYKGRFLSDDGVPMVNLACFTGDGKFDPERAKPYSGEHKERHLIHDGDLLMANTDITQKRRVLGSPAITYLGHREPYLFTHHTYAIRFHPGTDYLRRFLYHAFLEERFRARARGFATGTTVLALPPDVVLDYRFPRPPRSLVEEFNRITDPLQKRQSLCTEQSRVLQGLRDDTLPKIISGETSVRKAHDRVRRTA